MIKRFIPIIMMILLVFSIYAKEVVYDDGLYWEEERSPLFSLFATISADGCAIQYDGKTFISQNTGNCLMKYNCYKKDDNNCGCNTKVVDMSLCGQVLPLPTPPTICTDKDGDNPNIYGVTTTYKFPIETPHPDRCMTDSWLEEGICDNGMFRYKDYVCSITTENGIKAGGCKNGKCGGISEKRCVDSDGGKSYNIKGDISINGIKKVTDRCLNNNELEEFYCDSSTDSGLNGVEYKCQGSQSLTCSDGKCVEGTIISCITTDNGIKVGNGYYDNFCEDKKLVSFYCKQKSANNPNELIGKKIEENDKCKNETKNETQPKKECDEYKFMTCPTECIWLDGECKKADSITETQFEEIIDNEIIKEIEQSICEQSSQCNIREGYDIECKRDKRVRELLAKREGLRGWLEDIGRWVGSQEIPVKYCLAIPKQSDETPDIWKSFNPCKVGRDIAKGLQIGDPKQYGCMIGWIIIILIIFLLLRMFSGGGK